MHLHDPVYGIVNIREPILLKLIRHPALLRLKHISQYGLPDVYVKFKNFSRYEHSLGVMILLHQLGANLEEQVAGLLHDVSVTAFSHISDWVFGKGRDGIEDYHNALHHHFVHGTDLPRLLRRFGLLDNRVLEDSNYTLLESPIPDLCADRVDYAFREFYYWLDPSLVKSCLPSLINYNGRMIFKDKKSALYFAAGFLELQSRHWGESENTYRYHLFASVMSRALKLGLITEKDFYQKSESDILNLITASPDPQIWLMIKLLSQKKITPPKITSKNTKTQKITKKFRYVDPPVLQDQKLIRLSQLSPAFVRLLARRRRLNQQGIIVPVVQ